MESKYRAFFITDNDARWRAFVVSCSFASAFTVILYLLGCTQRVALSIGTASSLVVFIIRTLQYVPKTDSVATLTPYSYYLSRRGLVATVLALMSDWTLATLFEDVSVAVAFAQVAEDSIRAGKKVSLVKASFYKAVITSRLSKTIPTTDRKKLLGAYAALNSAQTFSSLGNVSSSQAVFRFPATLPVAIVIKATDIVFDGITFAAIGSSSVVQRKPILVETGNPSLRVMFKGCRISGFTQDLASVIWFDVHFENCAINIPWNRLTLVNVSFSNCTITCDNPVAQLVPVIESGDAIGVTIASITTDVKRWP
jgi:hypothetical protein